MLMTRTVQVVKALADPTRLRIVHLLHGRGELCVCEIVGALGLPQYRVSRHLSVLKAAGVISGWRQGKWMHYALDRRLPARDRAIAASICARLATDPKCQQDGRRLARHLRPRVKGGVVCCRS